MKPILLSAIALISFSFSFPSKAIGQNQEILNFQTAVESRDVPTNNSASVLLILAQNTSWKQWLRRKSIEIFKREGVEEDEIEIVDDETEEFLEEYGWALAIFVLIFSFMAIETIFFKK